EAVKILIFAAEGLAKRSAEGSLLSSLIMFETCISCHNSYFFSDKLVITSFIPASSVTVLHIPKSTSSIVYIYIFTFIQDLVFFLISWFSLLLLQLLRHLFYRHLKLHRQRYILIVCRLMLVMVVFFIAFRWIHLSTPLIRLFLFVLILLLLPTLTFFTVWFAFFFF